MNQFQKIAVAKSEEEFRRTDEAQRQAAEREYQAELGYRLRSELRYAAETAAKLGVDRKAFLTAAAREYDWELSAREPL